MKKSKLKRRGIRKLDDKSTGPMYHGPWFFDIPKVLRILRDINY